MAVQLISIILPYVSLEKKEDFVIVLSVIQNQMDFQSYLATARL